mmetsp:Transcript_68845/g.128490  ORF Transcript_68845/g.128490 Transcript_68845/m.128490 type:complete len:260 (+) Transcript_68845:91-870(+)
MWFCKSLPAAVLICVLGLGTHGLQAERPVSRASSPLEPSAPAVLDTPVVRVDIFYETLCPDCQSLLGEKLTAIWEDPVLRSALNVHLHPSGNAELTGVGNAQELNCQHGTDECHGNAVHACAMKVWEPENYLPVVMCMEAKSPESAADIDKAFSSCAKARNLSIHEVASCLSASTEVQSMMFGHYHATQALKPPHEWVPWVLLNGEHDYHADMGELHEAICNLLRAGDGAPASCRHVASLAEQQQNSTTAQLCYAGKRT